MPATPPFSERRAASLRVGLLLGLLAATLSCDSTFIDPFDNEAHFYSIYGFLDVLAEEHTVRVIPVTRRPERIVSPTDPQATIDAQVTSTDLATGVLTRWQHRLERLGNGTYGHVFSARFLVQPGRTYRLEVQRSDGTTATAETTVPRPAALIPDPDTLFFPYEISPDQGWPHEVYLPDIASPWDFIVTYDLQGQDVRLPYGRPGMRTVDGGWRFAIDMKRDAPRMRDAMGIAPGSPLPLLHAIILQVRVLDADWDLPGGVLDEAALAQPGARSNVTNGYGFWGSVGLYQYTWAQSPGAGGQH